jgi:pimeloyl-ACP methyl ester carboxylesterase
MLSLYRLMPVVYFLLPIVAVPWAVRAARRGSIRGAPQSLAGIFLAGGLLGLAVTQIWSWLLGTHVATAQAAVAMYWMTAILCLLAGINLVLNRWTRRAVRGCVALSTSNGRRRFFAMISGLLIASKGLLMTAVGASIVAATLLSFRPKVVHEGTPASILGATFETIDFRATDGIRLRGWWIPSTSHGNTSTQTVLLCHGFGSDKANVLPIARDLISSGFNVLAFDFRAHGESGGQLSTFGNIERRDVLGAVSWLKSTRSEQSRRILGLGVNMGAAALLAAASDPGVDGQAIEAIAAVDPYDDRSRNNASDQRQDFSLRKLPFHWRERNAASISTAGLRQLMRRVSGRAPCW